MIKSMNLGGTMIVMVAGVYGVGKSTVCNKLSKDLMIDFFSASELIRSEKGSITWGKDKKTDEISSNQHYLINAISRMLDDDFLLDGHFCLLDKEGLVKRIEFDIIRELNIGAVLFLQENPEIICKRLMDRDKIYWDEEVIEKMQKVEGEQALMFTEKYNLPFNSAYVTDYEEIKKFIKISYKSGG
ncbi:ATP-binding protein [Erwinia sp. B116]|uniref:ATP-binding protein n=1 Tax=Erwinia sp. B116 TaxID=1561024 RepID=UPI000CCAFE2B|nr:ATP-binding protein [Erwinia sp. B116]PLV53274.1 hypothetical protein NV64_18810 [Erwinia sp. B116]